MTRLNEEVEAKDGEQVTADIRCKKDGTCSICVASVDAFLRMAEAMEASSCADSGLALGPHCKAPHSEEGAPNKLWIHGGRTDARKKRNW